MASMEPRFPCRQEELEVSGSEIAYATRSEPLGKDSKRIQVLPSSRVGAASSAEMCVETLEELLGGKVFLKTNYVIENIKGRKGCLSDPGRTLARDAGSSSRRSR